MSRHAHSRPARAPSQCSHCTALAAAAANTFVLPCSARRPHLTSSSSSSYHVFFFFFISRLLLLLHLTSSSSSSSHAPSAICHGDRRMRVTAITGETSHHRLTSPPRPPTPLLLAFASFPDSLESPPSIRSIYVDIIDFIDCVIDTNGLLASCSVRALTTLLRPSISYFL
jgi:hypothetical protein